MNTKLPLSFYQRKDVIEIAKELLGKELFTKDDSGNITSGIIVETEAYDGPNDKACHSYGYRRTQRTETMYLPGGHVYVYLCYGIHHLCNVVTYIKDEPYAVLIRAIEPKNGIDLMMARRRLKVFSTKITSGPGSLSQAMGIDRSLDSVKLDSDRIWISETETKIPAKQIIASPRVGVAYAAEDALLPYRFRIQGNKFTSPAK